MEAKLAIKLIRSVRDVEKQLGKAAGSLSPAIQKALLSMTAVLQEAEFAVGLKVAGGGYYGAAWMRSQGSKAIQYVGIATKFTKFPAQARIFPTKEEAEESLKQLTSHWQTVHLWERRALTEEEVRGLQVMTEISK